MTLLQNTFQEQVAIYGIGVTGIGAQGVRGYQGYQGVQGGIGLDGVQGQQGIQGDIGLQGTQGFLGLIGTQGLQGVQGLIGQQGFQGAQGDVGQGGLQGRQGIQGTGSNFKFNTQSLNFAGGDAVVTHTLGTTPTSIFLTDASASAGDVYFLGVSAKNSTTFTCVASDSDTLIFAGTRTISWLVVA